MKLIDEVSADNQSLLPPLIRDYLSYVDSIQHLTSCPPTLDAFENLIRQRNFSREKRVLLYDVLSKQYKKLNQSATVNDNIQRLLDSNTFTITAAHQPCLLLGPLYNIIKICCTINVTQQLKALYPEQNFVPVFWLGSEDHDVEELSQTYVKGNKVVWATNEAGACGRWNTTSLNDVVGTLKSFDANEKIVQLLENAVTKHETFGPLTQHMLHSLFREYGLVVINQDEAVLKKSFAPIILDEVINQRAYHTLAHHLDTLEQNYKLQAQPRPINFFYLDLNSRERITYNSAEGTYHVNNRAVKFSATEIQECIENFPERFSPNVILRPLYQEHVLPNLAFVGGAGELSYWLELKPLFDYYGIPYPMQILRNSAILLNTKQWTKKEKLQLATGDLLLEVDVIIKKYISHNSGEQISLELEGTDIEEVFERIQKKAADIDPTLSQTAAAEKQKTLTALENIQAKMLRAQKRKSDVAIQQIQSLSNSVFPDGIFQERQHNFSDYYNEELIPVLVETLNPFTKWLKVYLTD